MHIQREVDSPDWERAVVLSNDKNLNNRANINQVTTRDRLDFPQSVEAMVQLFQGAAAPTPEPTAGLVAPPASAKVMLPAQAGQDGTAAAAAATAAAAAIPDLAVPPGFTTGIACGWNGERGFGFIRPDDGSDDVFCHVTAITDGSFLEKGSRVVYRHVFDESKGKYRAAEASGGTAVVAQSPGAGLATGPYDDDGIDGDSVVIDAAGQRFCVCSQHPTAHPVHRAGNAVPGGCPPHAERTAAAASGMDMD